MIRFPIPRLLALLLVATPAPARAEEFSVYPPAVVEVEATRVCVTLCGFRAHGLSLRECAGLWRFEVDVLRAFSRHVVRWTPGALCRAFSGWELKIRTEGLDPRTGGWVEPGFDYLVSGLTDPRARVVTIPSRSWRGSYLAHELAHVAGSVIDRHTPLDRFHVEWCTNNVAAAINAVSNLKETQCE